MQPHRVINMPSVKRNQKHTYTYIDMDGSNFSKSHIDSALEDEKIIILNENFFQLDEIQRIENKDQ